MGDIDENNPDVINWQNIDSQDKLDSKTLAMENARITKHKYSIDHESLAIFGENEFSTNKTKSKNLHEKDFSKSLSYFSRKTSNLNSNDGNNNFANFDRKIS